MKTPELREDNRVNSELEYILKRLDIMDSSFREKIESVQIRLETKIDNINVDIHELEKRLIHLEVTVNKAKKLRIAFTWPLVSSIIGGTIVGYIIRFIF